MQKCGLCLLAVCNRFEEQKRLVLCVNGEWHPLKDLANGRGGELNVDLFFSLHMFCRKGEEEEQ